MKWTWFLGSSFVIVSAACGPTLDVGQNQNDGSAPANGGDVCDAYATYCKIPSDRQKKVEDCRSVATDADCGAKAAEAYRCLMDNGSECNGAYELDDDISTCASKLSAYESCVSSHVEPKHGSIDITVALKRSDGTPTTCAANPNIANIVGWVTESNVTHTGNFVCADGNVKILGIPFGTYPLVVEARDSQGKSLGRSQTMVTFAQSPCVKVTGATCWQNVSVTIELD